MVDNLLTNYNNNGQVVTEVVVAVARHPWVGRKDLIQRLINAPKLRQNIASRTRLIGALVTSEDIDQDLLHDNYGVHPIMDFCIK